jgi:hypothetical protein
MALLVVACVQLIAPGLGSAWFSIGVIFRAMGKKTRDAVIDLIVMTNTSLRSLPSRDPCPGGSVNPTRSEVKRGTAGPADSPDRPLRWMAPIWTRQRAGGQTRLPTTSPPVCLTP